MGTVSAVTDMPPGDASPRCSRAACACRALSLSSSAVSSSDRVAAVRSVDFAAEDGVVAPPGGAPGTPAGYCWLLDVSFRRMARSGWTCDLGDGHDEAYETRKDLVAVATFPPFPFLFSCWCRRTTA